MHDTFEKIPDFAQAPKEMAKESINPTMMEFFISKFMEQAHREGIEMRQEALERAIRNTVIIYIHQSNGNVFRGTGSIIGTGNIVLSNRHVLEKNGIAFAYHLDGSRIPLQKRMLHAKDDIAVAAPKDGALSPEPVENHHPAELDKNRTYATLMPLQMKDGKLGLSLQKVTPGSCDPFSGPDRMVLFFGRSELGNDVHYRIHSEGGTSGSAIFDTATGETVAIHKGNMKYMPNCGQ